MRVVAVAVRASVVLVAVSIMVFAATELLPSDAAAVRAGGGATPDELARMRSEAGLDDPAAQRYLRWLAAMATGDTGTSLVSGRPVAALVEARAGATLALAGAALAVAVPLTALMAWAAGAAPRRVRAGAAGAVAGLAAVPQAAFAAGLVAVFSAALGWLPPVSLVAAGGSPLDRPETLVLPALALAVPAAAYGAGLLGGAVADALAAPHVADAVLRGVPRRRVAARHVLPFLLAPAVRVLATVAGSLLVATAVVETVFGYAGLGELLVSAVATRDVPVVQAVAMLSATVVVGGLAAADAAAALTDPRSGVPA
ncbi:ABC transporter permease subunit [Actinorugispora endophytica]|uniref:Peptide/nickel transport system permease protein n=1 Tax=Actinorugispora endophytica TaxID=1605990 RepID=A0A4R6UXG6_9ACTN|nr:ABC transporter permease [Actinorugispora endophytica]TDQ50265.1 peptide/nickel transport system permease protein [Actinorugispora endophytica]